MRINPEFGIFKVKLAMWEENMGTGSVFRSKTLITVFATAIGVATMAPAQAPADNRPFIIDFQKADALRDGDLSQLEYFERCAVKEPVCAIFAGTVLRNHDRLGDAGRLYRLALANGDKRAATSLAVMHTERKARVEAYAWSHLAYVLSDPRRDLSETETAKLLSFRYLATNYQAMTGKQRDKAELRAMTLVDEWIPRLYEKTQQQPHEGKAPETTAFEGVLEIVKRQNPRYPRGLAMERLTGFATVYALVGLDGRVINAIPLDYNHLLFARAAVKAVEKWQFRITDPERVEPVPITQTVEFVLNDLASR